MGVRLDKPWLEISQVPRTLKGHLGVFQIADAQQQVIYIGYAGGKSQFGLKGAVAAAVAELDTAAYFRHEITSSYMSRFRELMMVHIHDHGGPPLANPPIKLGKLSPG